MPRCKECQIDVEPVLCWQECKDGKRIREDCPVCGKYIRWAPQTVQNIEKTNSTDIERSEIINANSYVAPDTQPRIKENQSNRIISVDILQEIVNYLSKQPFEEVHHLIQALLYLPNETKE